MKTHAEIETNYQRIYLQYASLLINFAGKFVSRFYAEDIVHDVFLKLWDRQIFLLSTDELKKILYVAVRNACIDHLRRSSVEQQILDQQAVSLALEELNFFESSEALFMREDIMQILLAKIDELPEKSREIFRLFYLQGKKTTEIAEQLELSTRTVENQLYRSLLSLRKSCSHLFIYLLLLVLAK